MKAILNKSYLNLPPSERRKIDKVCDAEVVERVDKYFTKLQVKWLKAGCIVNARMGMSKEENLLWLANWREVYRMICNTPTDGAQDEFLNAEMTRIFGENGFPEQYINKLEGR
jgi:hypothetical protein